MQLQKEKQMKIQEVEVKKIQDNPYQMRESIDKDSLKDLISSILQRGLLSPIQLLKDGENYIIICGHRRVEAFRSLKKKTIPAIVKERQQNNELIVDLVHENLIREDLNPMEKAISIKLLISQIKTTNDDLDRMLSLIGKLKNYNRRGHFPENKSEHTKGFDEYDIFRLDKILKSLGISENNAVTYLSILKLPKSIQRCLIFSRRGMDRSGKILLKQAEQLVRIQDPEYREHLFQKALDGATINSLRARADVHLKKIERGEWNGIQKKYTTRFKDDLKRVEFVSDEARKLTRKLESFKMDTLIKLDETLEKEEFIAHMTGLKRYLELLNGQIDEKLEDRGFKPVKKEIDTFEIKVNYSKTKSFYRSGVPVKVARQLNLSEDQTEFLKVKVIERKQQKRDLKR